MLQGQKKMATIKKAFFFFLAVFDCLLNCMLTHCSAGSSGLGKQIAVINYVRTRFQWKAFSRSATNPSLDVWNNHKVSWKSNQ